jgi:DNA-binding response OmpR family regulator
MKEFKYGILFIEDDEEIRKNYVSTLKDYYKDVYESSSGVVAYQIYLDKKPDILIADIEIFDMSGLELIKKIRENDHSTRVIMLTSYSDVETLLKATELKLTKYLVKPVRRKELIEALNLAIDEINNFSTTSNEILILKNNFFWNIKESELCYENRVIKLTKRERKILSIIFKNNQKITTYEEILYEIWNENNEKTLHSLKTMMSNIKNKLSHNIIENEYGIGYRVN